jgi:SAM-dependent methyltransferase
MNAPASNTSPGTSASARFAPATNAGVPALSAPGWDPAWENNVYGQGRHLNRYPHHAVVGVVYRHFGRAIDRAALRFCELGCGAGNNVWFAAREGFSTAGIDGSASAIAYARERLAGEGLNADLRVGDFAALPWPDGSFDFVLDRGSLTCVRQSTLVQALDEARRVLKPGGRFLSLIYSARHPDRLFGRDLGDNSYDQFSAGYFAGLGIAHFVPRAEIESLYAARFEITGLTHLLDTDELNDGHITNALWKIECRRPAGSP